MSNELDKALLARSRKEHRDNINTLFKRLQAVKDCVKAVHIGIPGDEKLELALGYLENIDQSLIRLIGAGWMTEAGFDRSEAVDNSARLAISVDLQNEVLYALDEQVRGTGFDLSRAVSWANGEALADMPDGNPSNEQLVNLLVNAHERMSLIIGLFDALMIALTTETSELERVGRQYLEDLCDDAIKRANTPRAGI